ncbi:MAG: S-layer homology domain-containing protein [Firmicutes bacterium]|nr:S-layer homology domain-containing protein [Bacillota bacterium]
MFESVKQFYTDSKVEMVLNDGVSINETGSVLLFRLLSGTLRQPSEAGYLVIEWSAPSGGTPTVDKSALAAAIDSVTGENAANWYQQNDRYNGKETSKSGFWADMQPSLSYAQTIYNKANATQAQVDAAAEDLAAAIGKLIPAAQLNATGLYERIQNHAGKAAYVEEHLSEYTAVSAEAFLAAMTAARSYLDGLFAEGAATATNIAANQSVADGYADALWDAFLGLMTWDGIESLKMWRDTVWKLNGLFDGLEAADYEAESWQAFAAARQAANDFVEEHPLDESFSRTDNQAYTSAARTYWLAAYGLRSLEAPTATLYFSDDFGMRNPEWATGISYQQNLTLAADKRTLKDLLTQAGIPEMEASAPWALDYSHHYGNSRFLDDAWLVYINGVLIRDPQLPSSGVAQTIGLRDYNGGIDWRDICIKDGDVVVVARVEAAMVSGYLGGEQADFELKFPYIGQLSMQPSQTTVAEGEAITATVRRWDSYLPDYTGESSACDTAALAAYGPQNPDGSWPAEPIVSNDATLALYEAGDYLLTAFEPRAQDVQNKFYPNLTVSSLPVEIHITPLSDQELAAEKEAYLARLDAALAGCDADELGEVTYGRAVAVIDAAKEAMAEATSMAQMQRLLDQALAELEALRQASVGSTDAILAKMREYLKLLPSIEQINEGKFTQNDIPRMGWAKDLYDFMSPYQKSLLTTAENRQWQALLAAFGEDGSALPAAATYTATVSVVNGDETMRLRIQGNSVDEENHWNVTFDEYGDGSQPLSVPYGASHDDVIYTTIYIPIDSLEEDSVVSAFLDNLKPLSSSPPGAVTTINGQRYRYYSYSFYNPRRDFTIVVTLPGNDALSQAKDAALASLQTAYNGYRRGDYEDENWTTLRQAYQTGVNGINAAESESAIDTALADAIAAMAAVEPKDAPPSGPIAGWGPGDPFDAGPQVGTVTLSVENNTFPEGDFTGLILYQPDYPIGENDTMMTVILRALRDNGFTGTDSSGRDRFDITYLAMITKDGKELGEMSGEITSGWMGSLNDFMVNEGFPQFSVAGGLLGDGDVIKVMFTQNLGVDLGGTWNNNNTTLASLEISPESATLMPDFYSGSIGNTYDFALLIEGDSERIKLTPHAANINFMVKTFLNEKVTTNDIGNSYYRLNESIPVQPGDVIYVGCGERAWPSMNTSGKGTWYALHVISADDGADYVNERIAGLPAINQIGMGNYENVLDQIAEIERIIEVLNDGEKARVNRNALEAARDRARFFAEIDEAKARLAALPKSSSLSDDEVQAAREEIEAAAAAYESLNQEQQDYFSVNEVANLNALVARLEGLAVETYTVVFHPGLPGGAQGSGQMRDLTVNKGEDFTLPACGFDPPEDMEFDQWLIDNDRFDPEDQTGGDFTGDTLDVWATWKDKANAGDTYAITVTGGGKAYSDANKTQVITEAAAGDTVYVGYDEPAAGKYVTDVKFEGASLNANDYAGGVTMPDRDVTFAIVTANRQTCTVDLSSGSGSIPAEAYLYNRPLFSPAFPVAPIVDQDVDLDNSGNADMTVNWNTGDEAVDAVRHADCDIDGSYTVNVSQSNTPYMAIVYKFDDSAPVYHLVVFDGNGHGTAPAPVWVEHGQAVACPADPIADAGWKFTGWYENEACTKAYEFSTPILKDTVIFAGWRADSATAPVAPKIITRNLPDGKVGTAYSEYLDASGDTPITWTLRSGSLPDGLSLSRSGKISGKPTKAGDFTFTVKAENNAGHATKSFTITIDPADIAVYTLTYNSNGGSAIAASKHDSGTTVKLTATPIREGYIFTGWYADGALTKKITSIKMDGNKTVYAGWQAIVPILPVPAAPGHGHDCPSLRFTDVDTNAWYHEYIDYVVEKGLMQGVTADRFAPNAATTRAMIVTMLYRLEGSPAAGSVNPFKDVANGSWYANAVIWANANGIVEGYGNGKFGPTDNITREQMAAILYRYARYKGYDVSKQANLSGYTDAAKVSSWALPAMQWANAENLITGRTATTLAPGGNATRAEVAAILQRFIER